MNHDDHPPDNGIDFSPLPKATIPPVIHSTYIPHRPKRQSSALNLNSSTSPFGSTQFNNATPGGAANHPHNTPNATRLESGLAHYARQHSYNANDYEVHRRKKIQERAHSQLLTENPQLQTLLTPSPQHPTSRNQASEGTTTPPTMSNQPSTTLALPDHQQLEQATITPTPASVPATDGKRKPRRGFGESMATLGQQQQQQNQEPQQQNQQQQQQSAQTTKDHHSNQPPKAFTFSPPPASPIANHESNSSRNTPHFEEDQGLAQGFATWLPQAQSPLHKEEEDGRERSSSASFILIEDDDPISPIPQQNKALTKQSSTQPASAATTPAGAGGGGHNPQPLTTQNSLGNLLHPTQVTTSPTGLKTPLNKKPPVGSDLPQLLASNVLHTPHGIDFNLIEPGHESCLMSVDVVQHMQRGVSAIKHGRRGKPHTSQLKLGPNCRWIVWDSKNKNDGDNVIRFNWITKIQQGQQSEVFSRNRDDRVERLSLTISYTRPEKYYHYDDSDDEDTLDPSQQQQQQQSATTKQKKSLLPSFFSKKAATPTTKRSTWAEAGMEHTTLDIVIEDPNDWLIWYNGLRIMTDMATNAINKFDTSMRLTKATTIPLSLPILTEYPSSQWIIDSTTGLSVKEQFENEKHQETNAMMKQMALTRKETVKEFIRRASSVTAFNLPPTPQQQQQQNGGVEDTPSPQQQQQHTPGQLKRQATSTSIKTILQQNQLLPPSLSIQNSSGTGDAIDLMFPNPWGNINIKGESDIVDNSWLQQIIYYGPKIGHGYEWRCGYTISTNAASYSRLIEATTALPKDVLLAGVDKRDNQEIEKRNRVYNSFLQRAGGLSIMILRSKEGDILGGYATQPWVQQWGFVGTPDCFVFNIVEDEFQVDVDLNQELTHNDVNVTFHNDVMATPRAKPTPSIQAEPNIVQVDKSVSQLHIYRWCGGDNARLFQMVNKDSFGFGANLQKNDDHNGEDGGNDNNNNTTPSSNSNNNNNNTSPHTTGGGNQFDIVSSTTGPAFSLNNNIQDGLSYPCPIFKSPQLTKNKQFTCFQFEIWCPIPSL